MDFLWSLWFWGKFIDQVKAHCVICYFIANLLLFFIHLGERPCETAYRFI